MTTRESPNPTRPPEAPEAPEGPQAPRPAEAPVRRCLTVDVEEYYHIEACHGRLNPQHWDDWPSRVSVGVEAILQLLDEQKIHGTFFVLGDVARRSPNVVKRIADAGHEIASHGNRHDRLHRLDAPRFREDLRASIDSLQQLTGQRVRGYRAPTFSLVPQTAWAIEVMLELGLEYDSSIFPVVHPAYGVPEAPDRPFRVQGPLGARGRSGDSERSNTLLEIPPLTWHVGSRKLAVAGGGYFRLLPLYFLKRGLAQAAAEHRPAILYFHPWEFDPDFPNLPLSRTGKLRTYTGRARALARLREILRHGSGDETASAAWRPIRDFLQDFRQIAGAPAPYAL